MTGMRINVYCVPLCDIMTGMLYFDRRSIAKKDGQYCDIMTGIAKIEYC